MSSYLLSLCKREERDTVESFELVLITENTDRFPFCHKTRHRQYLTHFTSALTYHTGLQLSVICAHKCTQHRHTHTNLEPKNEPQVESLNLPSTHSCSMSVSMAATRKPTEKAPNTSSPMKRTFPQCRWM